jgi:hypothetical protein
MSEPTSFPRIKLQKRTQHNHTNVMLALHSHLARYGHLDQIFPQLTWYTQSRSGAVPHLAGTHSGCCNLPWMCTSAPLVGLYCLLVWCSTAWIGIESDLCQTHLPRLSVIPKSSYSPDNAECKLVVPHFRSFDPVHHSAGHICPAQPSATREVWFWLRTKCPRSSIV